ncbi:SoxR reducing system RseC family protein [Chakrabartyella piscis]|uniref:SoxR reducing system RseC family protein n=1 Tax=Chakrabartyella piscis TaxID=2918914 RepID=UPI0029583783|nr:SoxR reducing system RseC family protein [Chakrabartyella piscis]
MKGVVTKDSGKMVTVHIKRLEACGHCKGCLAGYMEQDMDLDAKNLCDATVGDWVELGLQENAFRNAVLVSYGLPLVGFMVCLFSGYYFLAPVVPTMDSGLVAFLCGFVGILVSYGWIKSQTARWEAGKYIPMALHLTTEDVYEEVDADDEIKFK